LEFFGGTLRLNFHQQITNILFFNLFYIFLLYLKSSKFLKKFCKKMKFCVKKRLQKKDSKKLNFGPRNGFILSLESPILSHFCVICWDFWLNVRPGCWNFLAHVHIYGSTWAFWWILFFNKKNGEALGSFIGIWPSRRKFPEFQMGLGFWCGELTAQRTTS
jgi:hypothetical protein